MTDVKLKKSTPKPGMSLHTWIATGGKPKDFKCTSGEKNFTNKSKNYGK